MSKAKAYPGEAHFRCSTVMLDPGRYSQHFIFFVTYERTLEPKKLQDTTLESLAEINTLAYLGHLQVTNKIKFCEYGARP